MCVASAAHFLFYGGKSMANCVLCEKEIGAFDKSYGTYNIIANGIVCANCFNILNDFYYTAEAGDIKRANELSKAFLGKYNYSHSASKISDNILELAKSASEIDASSKSVPDMGLKEKLSLLIKENAKEIEEKRKNFLSTTGNNFEGYIIKRYIGIISSESGTETAISLNTSANKSEHSNSTSDSIDVKLTAVKEKAVAKLIENCIITGANAVIGVNINIISLPNTSSAIASATGTAVVIEKIEETI